MLQVYVLLYNSVNILRNKKNIATATGKHTVQLIRTRTRALKRGRIHFSSFLPIRSPEVPPEVLSVLSVPDKKLEKLEKLELEEPKPSFHVFEFVSLSHV